MADDIVQTVRVQVEGTDEAAAEFKKVGDAGTEAFQQTQQAASTAGPAISQAGKQASAGLGATGAALDNTTKKAGLSRREMSALGKVMASFGGGEIAHAAVSIGRVGSALGALGVAAIGIGLAASALIKFGSEAIKTADAIDKLEKAGGGSFQSISNLQAAFAKAGVGFEVFGTTGLAVLEKIQQEAGKTGEAIAASTKAVDDAQLAYLKAKAAAEPYLAAVYAQDIKNAEAQQKHNQEIAAETALRKAQANELQPVINKFQQLADGVRVTFDAMTTGETKLEALKIALQGLNLDQTITKLAKMADSMGEIQKRDFARQLKGLGFDDKEIAQIEKGSAALAKLKQQTASKAFTEQDVAILKEVGNAYDTTALQVGNFGKTAVVWFGKAALGWKNIFSGQVSFGAVLAEAGNQLVGGLRSLGSAIAPIIQQWVTTPVQGAWNWIVDTAASVWESAKQLAGQTSDWLIQLITTAPGNAWQWIKDTAASVWESVKQLAQQAYDAVVQFVTAAPGNAWQWIVDTFNDAWAGVKASGQQLMNDVWTFVTSAPGNAWQWIVDTFNAAIAKIKARGFGGEAAPAGGGGGGFAGGGLLGGRGSGTSDSNLAWVSRGEYVVPAGAVRAPGVLEFLERLRLAGGNLRGVLSGMGRFTMGGLVMPRLSVPAFAGGGMNNVTIQFPGLPEITGLRASSGVVDELRKAAALAQVRSGGRKPSRYS